MNRIQRIHAREVFDSRGKPTVEVEVSCEGAGRGRAIVPSGASTGKFEALELRDGDPQRFAGNGVLQAVQNVRGEVAKNLIGMDADDQQAIDRRLCELDGTENKSRLGANAILGVSIATACAAANAQRIDAISHFRQIWNRVPEFQQHPDVDMSKLQTERTNGLGQKLLLPLPMVNMISGGLHAGRNLDFQDFLILPIGAESFRQAFEWIVTVYQNLGHLLTKMGLEGTLVGDEGGFGPKMERNNDAAEAIIAAIEQSELRPGQDVALGLDVASTHFFQDGTYRLAATGGERLSSDQLIDLLEDWINKYPIISIEDALAEDDWSGWQRLTQRLGHRVQTIGDDLFVTNSKRLLRGIGSQTANSILIKFNQIGTLWETLQTLRMAIDCGYWPVISARSGETEDTTIADLVVATGAGQLKVGSVARSERLAKYNQLLRLEEDMSGDIEYWGGKIFSSLT